MSRCARKDSGLVQGQRFHQCATTLLDQCLDVCSPIRKSLHQSRADSTTDHIDVSAALNDLLNATELRDVHDQRDACLFT